MTCLPVHCFGRVGSTVALEPGRDVLEAQR